MHTCQKLCVVINHMPVSSVCFITIEKFLLTDIDKEYTTYAEGYVTFAQEIKRHAFTVASTLV